MALNANGTEAALNHVASLISHVSIHSADPGATGLNEIGTRQTVSWNPAAGTNLDNAGTVEFAVTSGQTIHSVGLWSAATGGTFYGFKALPAPESFGNDGTFTINDLDINITAA